MIVIGFSMLGPSIIFSMLIYAQVSAFAVDSSTVLVYNAVPVCLFIACCFLLSSGVQLLFAKIVSVVYAFIMLAVLVATTHQIVLESKFPFHRIPRDCFNFSDLLSHICFRCFYGNHLPSCFVCASKGNCEHRVRGCLLSYDP